MRRLGVLGWPVAHSRSPAMHRAAFAELGLNDWSYQLLPVPAELFVETVRALGAAGFVGANVTLPHKTAALDLADSATPSARAIGAANTLSIAGDGTIAAANTDAPGLINALAAIGRDPAGATALVLGAGGSARAVVWALREAGADVSVWNRTPARAARLADELGVRPTRRAEPAEILVNCTTVGLGGCTTGLDEMLSTLPLTADALGEYACLVDLVYSERPTTLLQAALDRGLETVDGLEILIHQGALSFTTWTGRSAPLAAMRRGVRSAPRSQDR